MFCFSPSPSEKASEETDPSHHQDGEGEVKVAGSNASTLSTASSYTEKDSASSSVCSDDHTVSEYDIVKRVLYSTRENVNIVHEVFRQVTEFLLLNTESWNFIVRNIVNLNLYEI